MPFNEEKYNQANKSNNFIIVSLILLILGVGISIYFFISYKSDNDNNNQISTSATSFQSDTGIPENTLTYGNILPDGQNTGFYNRFSGFNKNYSNKLNGTKLNNSTICEENNGKYLNNTCFCLAPFYGERCQEQDFNQDFYEVHAKIYYDDGIAFIKPNSTVFENDYDIYNIYPGWKNQKTPSMLDYPYNGRFTWYTKEPNGNIIPPFQNILTPTSYSSQDFTSKGVYIVRDELIEKCFILRGIYVIQLLDKEKDAEEYNNFIILMKKDFQFDFSIKDKIIGIPDPLYTGMLYTPKPYFEYENIDLDCEFLDTAVNPILTTNQALTKKKNFCFFPNPMIVLNGKFDFLKTHNGKECPISTSQYPFGALDAFQCTLKDDNKSTNKYPYHDYKSSASQLYTKLKRVVENNCPDGNCNDVNTCATPKCDDDVGDTSDNYGGDFNLGGCLRSIRNIAVGSGLEPIYQNRICRQKIPATNLSVPQNINTTFQGKKIFDFKYYSKENKENTCLNSTRCEYSKQSQSNQGDRYGIVYTNYLRPSQIKALDPSDLYNIYDEKNTSYGKDFWSVNTSFTNEWYSSIVGNNSIERWAGFKNPQTPGDINIIFGPCCRDSNNKCFYDFDSLENFRKFGNFKFTPKTKDENYDGSHFKNQRCYFDYNPFNNAYDNIHLNNYRPRGVDTYNISFAGRNLYFTNFYNAVETPTTTIKMQSLVKIKLPEYTYIVNKPSRFSMDPNAYDSTYKWPKIFNESMATDTGLDLYGLLYIVNQLVLPNENQYYQSLGPLIPCSCRCASEVLSSSVTPFPS